MDAFQLLKNDHKIVSAIFEEVQSASGQRKSTLFNRLKQELDVHADIEERFFYPALENKREAREITLEAYEEHKVVKDLLAELANGGSAEDEWDAKLKVLRENVEHHVEEEESELFDKAGDVLSDEEIEQIGTEMEAEKRRQLGTRSQDDSSRPEKVNAAKRAREKDDNSPGMLKRLASLVSLGSSPSKAKKKSASGKSAGKKKVAGKSAARKKAAGTAKKATKGTATRSASKSAGSRKAAGRKTGRTTSKRTTATRGSSNRKAAAKKRRQSR